MDLHWDLVEIYHLYSAAEIWKRKMCHLLFRVFEGEPEFTYAVRDYIFFHLPVFTKLYNWK